ncbi:hypothetical protein BaRGS_00020782, partial [Batillaria attramentaria]
MRIILPTSIHHPVHLSTLLGHVTLVAPPTKGSTIARAAVTKLAAESPTASNLTQNTKSPEIERNLLSNNALCVRVCGLYLLVWGTSVLLVMAPREPQRRPYLTAAPAPLQQSGENVGLGGCGG